MLVLFQQLNLLWCKFTWMTSNSHSPHPMPDAHNKLVTLWTRDFVSCMPRPQTDWFTHFHTLVFYFYMHLLSQVPLSSSLFVCVYHVYLFIFVGSKFLEIFSINRKRYILTINMSIITILNFLKYGFSSVARASYTFFISLLYYFTPYVACCK